MILTILIFGLAAFTALSMVRNRQWPVELLTHFRPHAIAVSLALGLVALLLGHVVLAAMAIGVAMLNWSLMRSFKWLRPDPALAGQPGLTLVWANVWTKRSALERTLEWAKTQNADVILIGEFPDGDSSDAELAPDYPHRLDALPGVPTRTWSSRVVAFSKLPISSPEVTPAPGVFLRPFLRFAVDIKGSGKLNVYAAHPNAPMKPDLQRDRDAMIGMLAGTVVEPFVLAGDFNATPWCPVFSAIPGVRAGSAFRPSWLTRIPLLGLPIDHIMTSAGVRPSAYTPGPFLGSDHRPVLARIHMLRHPT